MIELRGVAKQYLYGARVLGSVDLRVADGEIVALLGGVGSGKTTLLKCVADVTDCEGEVLVDGKPVGKRPDDVIMVFDDLAVFKNRSFYYNLAYPLKIRGVDKHETDRLVNAAAKRMGIVACLGEKVRKMPLIDVKRLALARLFLRDYRALLVDDITRGLSREEADELWTETAPILVEAARKGASVIFATTDRSEAISVAHRIAVMNCGEIKQVDTAKNIYEFPSNIWAAQAVDEHYRFERARLERRDGKLWVVFAKDGGEECSLDARVFDGEIADGFEGKDIYVGWHAEDYDTVGDALTEDVSYAVRDGVNNGFLLYTASGARVRCEEFRERVGVLPKIKKARLFELYSENSLHKDNTKDKGSKI